MNPRLFGSMDARNQKRWTHVCRIESEEHGTISAASCEGFAEKGRACRVYNEFAKVQFLRPFEVERGAYPCGHCIRKKRKCSLMDSVEPLRITTSTENARKRSASSFQGEGLREKRQQISREDELQAQLDALKTQMAELTRRLSANG